MTDIYQSSEPSSYAFSSSKYFCTNCNRQFSQIKVDRNSTVARCPRCNLYADEVQMPRQPTVNNNTRPMNQEQPRNAQNANTHQRNNIFSFIPFGNLFEPQQRNNSAMNIETEPQIFVDPFSAFFGVPTFTTVVFQPAAYDDATIEEFLRDDPNKYGPPPASEEAIKKLQEVKYNAENAENKCCPVCQDDYKKDETLVKLPCGHDYHKDCVTSWLTKHNSCPLCRTQI